jgi:hypothetical protein
MREAIELNEALRSNDAEMRWRAVQALVRNYVAAGRRRLARTRVCQPREIRIV